MTRWQKIGLAVVIAFIGITVLVALGFRAKTGMRNFLYPHAPPMPSVVGESMPDILAHLELVLKTNAPSVLAELQPGLSAEAIAKLEQQYHVQIPDDIKMIYEWHDGAPNKTNLLNDGFIPGHIFLSLEDTLADRAMAWQGASATQLAVGNAIVGYRRSWIHLFDDGAGDGYWFDPQRQPAEGAVFYNFTETGSFVFFSSAKNLMAGVARCYESGAFHMKLNTSPPELDEDYQMAGKIWGDFGASNPQ